jgi:putative ABC transport system permease protein
VSLFWKLAFKNLLRHRRRNLTTALAIIIGFSGLTLVGAFILRAKYARKAQTVHLNLSGHLQIHKQDGYKKFSVKPAKYVIDSDLDKKLTEVLASFKNQIDFEARFLTGTGLILKGEYSQPFQALGYEREIFLKAMNNAAVQRWAKDWINKSVREVTEADMANVQMISVTPKIGRILGTSISDSVQLMTRTMAGALNAADADIGMMHTTGIEFADDYSIQAALPKLQELLGTDGYQYKALYLKDGVDEKKLLADLEGQFAKEGLPFEVFHFTADGIGDVYNGVMSFLYVIGLFFFFLILCVVVLSISNTLAMGIVERAKELGCLKALGFSKESIVGLFVKEASWLAGGSLLIGLLFSQFVARLINFLDIRYNPPGVEGSMQFFLAPELSVYCVLAVLLFLASTVTAYIVSNRRLQMSSIQLLTE